MSLCFEAQLPDSIILRCWKPGTPSFQILPLKFIFCPCSFTVLGLKLQHSCYFSPLLFQPKSSFCTNIPPQIQILPLLISTSDTCYFRPLLCRQRRLNIPPSHRVSNHPGVVTCHLPAGVRRPATSDHRDIR